MTGRYATNVDGFTLRPFRPGDEVAVVALNAYGLAAAGIPPDQDYYAGEDTADIARTYSEAAGGLMLVGEVDAKIVAMGAIRRLDMRTCEILRMRVYSKYHGRGYGRAVLRLLEQEAQRLGYRRATLITGEDQHPAIDLYRRHGYRISRREILIGIRSVHMSKDLGAAES